MSRVGFSLLELIIVVFLIGVFSFISIKLPSAFSQKSFGDLRELVYPEGEFYIFEDKSVLLIKNSKKIPVKFSFSDFKVYDLNLQEKKFPKYNGKKVIFYYSMKNGIGDVLIVKEKNIYLFKPLFVLKYKNMESLKKSLTLTLREGEYE